MFGGETFCDATVSRLRESLAAHTGSSSPPADIACVLAAESSQPSTWSGRVVRDRSPSDRRHPGWGLLAVLDDAASRKVDEDGVAVIAGVDQPFLKPDWVTRLVAEASATERMTAFRGNFWQPFPCAFPTRCRSDLESWSRLVEAALRSSLQISLQRLFDTLDAAAVPLPGDWPAVGSLNRPTDLDDEQACPPSVEDTC